MRVMPIDPNLNIIRDGLIVWIDPRMRTSYIGSGSAINDISGFGNNITITSGAGTLVTFDSAQYSFIYAGSTEKVQRTYVSGDEYDLNLTKRMTLEYWYKSDNVNRSANGGVGFGALFGSPSLGELQWQYQHFYTGTTYAIDFGVFNGTSQLYQVTSYGSDPNYQVPISLQNNVWVQIAGTYNQTNGQLNMYVNGILCNSLVSGSNLTGTIQLPSSANRILSIGARRSGLPGGALDGNIGVVRVYNRALTEAEITHNFNQQRTRFGI